MSASSYTTKTPGSTIHGIPLSVEYYESYLNSYAELALEAIEQAVHEYEAMAKSELVSDPYWESFIDDISFEFDATSSSIEFSGPFEMEYGDGEYPPAGVLRKYALIAEDELPRKINKATRGAI